LNFAVFVTNWESSLTFSGDESTGALSLIVFGSPEIVSPRINCGKGLTL
jgi:hypothetical protein